MEVASLLAAPLPPLPAGLWQLTDGSAPPPLPLLLPAPVLLPLLPTTGLPFAAEQLFAPPVADWLPLVAVLADVLAVLPPPSADELLSWLRHRFQSHRCCRRCFHRYHRSRQRRFRWRGQQWRCRRCRWRCWRRRHLPWRRQRYRRWLQRRHRLPCPTRPCRCPASGQRCPCRSGRCWPSRRPARSWHRPTSYRRKSLHSPEACWSRCQRCSTDCWTRLHHFAGAAPALVARVSRARGIAARVLDGVLDVSAVAGGFATCGNSSRGCGCRWSRSRCFDPPLRRVSFCVTFTVGGLGGW